MNQSKKPLAVDLDGTLVRTDTLYEQFLKYFRTSPFGAMKLLLQVPFIQKNKFKSILAGKIRIDPALLPYRSDLVEYIRSEKLGGREVILATASHERVARDIADYLDLFDDVLATSDTMNLKGEKKARALVDRYGEDSFVYAGDDKSDAAIWSRAGEAILVGATHKLQSLTDARIEKTFRDEMSSTFLILKEMRLYQWVKNVLVFVPLLAAGQIFEPVDLAHALTAFFAFGFTASGVYALNDLTDIDADRSHREKCHRPFASGKLKIRTGMILIPALFTLGFVIALSVNFDLALVLLLYGTLTTWYSLQLKTRPIFDVFTLAALYSLRVMAGGVATDIKPSVWLLSFSGLLFLSLAFLKRYVETFNVEQEGKSLVRRGYESGESQIQMIMGIASGFSAAIVFALWLDSTAFHTNYSNQLFVWLVVPLFLLWLNRIWLAAYRGRVHEDPIVFTVKDRISWAIIGCCGVFYSLGIFA